MNEIQPSGGSSSLASRVKTGFLWTILGRGGNQLISFCFGVVLARILAPEDFGAIAACLVFTEIGSTLVAASYVSTLIRKPEVSDLEMSTVFVLQLLTSVLVALLLCAISPLVAKLLSYDIVAPVLCLLSVNLIILAFQGNANVIANRAMDFRTITKVSVFEMLVFGVVAVALAFQSFGVWSLVAGRIAGRLVSTLLFVWWVRWKPSLRFSREVAKSLFSVSSQFAGKEILDDISKNIAYLFTGWAQNMTQLGFYSRAHYLMTLPVDRISKSLEKVLFPAFSQIQDQPERLQLAFVKSNCLMAVIVCPALVGLSLLAEAFIIVVYGEKWAPSVLPLQIISFAGIFYALEAPAVALINAMGYLMSEIARQVLHITLILVCIAVGNQWGLAGIAAGVTVAAFLYWSLLIQLLKSRLTLRRRHYLASLLPALIATMGMAAAIFGVRYLLEGIVEPVSLAGLILDVAVGVVSYGLLIVIIARTVRQAIWSPALMEIENSLFSMGRKALGMLRLR